MAGGRWSSEEGRREEEPKPLPSKLLPSLPSPGVWGVPPSPLLPSSVLWEEEWSTLRSLVWERVEGLEDWESGEGSEDWER